MTEAEEYRRKSDELLRQATTTQNLGERSRLISLAVHWNELAAEAQRVAATARRAEGAGVPFDQAQKAP